MALCICLDHAMSYESRLTHCPACLWDYQQAGEPEGCYHCGSTAHASADCPMPIEYETMVAEEQ